MCFDNISQWTTISRPPEKMFGDFKQLGIKKSKPAHADYKVQLRRYLHEFIESLKILMEKTLFAQSLSDDLATDKAVTKELAEKLFNFFKNCKTFRWADANNDCEDRANAICILLDAWKISNGKGWVFSGYVFKKVGYLKNLWVYHVAAAIPVREGDNVSFYIIDPATSSTITTVAEWAENVTDNPHSYHLIKNGTYYIFPSKTIRRNNWFQRNKRNYNWTIQGLSGINGVSSKGKAQLRFNKRKVKKTEMVFKELKKSPPVFLQAKPA